MSFFKKLWHTATSVAGFIPVVGPAIQTASSLIHHTSTTNEAYHASPMAMAAQNTDGSLAQAYDAGYYDGIDTSSSASPRPSQRLATNQPFFF